MKGLSTSIGRRRLALSPSVLELAVECPAVAESEIPVFGSLKSRERLYSVVNKSIRTGSHLDLGILQLLDESQHHRLFEQLHCIIPIEPGSVDEALIAAMLIDPLLLRPQAVCQSAALELHVLEMNSRAQDVTHIALLEGDVDERAVLEVHAAELAVLETDVLEAAAVNANTVRVGIDESDVVDGMLESAAKWLVSFHEHSSSPTYVDLCAPSTAIFVSPSPSAMMAMNGIGTWLSTISARR